MVPDPGVLCRRLVRGSDESWDVFVDREIFTTVGEHVRAGGRVSSSCTGASLLTSLLTRSSVRVCVLLYSLVTGVLRSAHILSRWSMKVKVKASPA